MYSTNEPYEQCATAASEPPLRPSSYGAKLQYHLEHLFIRVQSSSMLNQSMSHKYNGTVYGQPGLGCSRRSGGSVRDCPAEFVDLFVVLLTTASKIVRITLPSDQSVQCLELLISCRYDFLQLRLMLRRVARQFFGSETALDFVP